jgi:hypothetical protein
MESPFRPTIDQMHLSLLGSSLFLTPTSLVNAGREGSVHISKSYLYIRHMNNSTVF